MPNYADLNNAHHSNQYDPLQFAKFGRVGNSELGAGFDRVQEADEAFRPDDDGTYIYIGTAIPGTETSSASWKIKRVTKATGVTLWADGNAYYDNVFDDRATLSYS